MVSTALIFGRNSVNVMKPFRFDALKSHRILNRQHRTSVRIKLPPSPPPTSGSLFSRLARPALFTVGFSATVFGAAAIFEHENKRVCRCLIILLWIYDFVTIVCACCIFVSVFASISSSVKVTLTTLGQLKNPIRLGKNYLCSGHNWTCLEST